MEIKEIKEKMIAYRDLYGQQMNVDSINLATTKEELASIIDTHEQHIEDCCNDATRSLGRFKQSLKFWD
jgi:hypothetical protein